jgi:hypothetical protein
VIFGHTEWRLKSMAQKQRGKGRKGIAKSKKARKGVAKPKKARKPNAVLYANAGQYWAQFENTMDALRAEVRGSAAISNDLKDKLDSKTNPTLLKEVIRQAKKAGAAAPGIIALANQAMDWGRKLGLW